MAIILDTFTEAANTALELHTSDDGKAWFTPASPGMFVEASTDALVTQSDFDRYVGANVAPASADYFVEIIGRTNTIITTHGFGALGRFTGTNGIASQNAYRARILGSGAWELHKILAGTATLLDSGTIAGFSTTQDYALRLVMQGTTIRVLIDTVQVSSVTDGDVSAAGKPGVALRGTVVRATSFEADVLAAPTMSPAYRTLLGVGR